MDQVRVSVVRRLRAQLDREMTLTRAEFIAFGVSATVVSMLLTASIMLAVGLLAAL